jgi:hypothetical protein
VHIKHAKEELVKEIKDLREEKHIMERIFEALSNDEKVPEVLERLQKSEPYESIVEWLGRSPLQDFEAFSPRDHNSTFGGSDHNMDGVSSTASRWTNVTSNEAVLSHLLQLYFAWVHPVHTLFSEGHFVDSYQGHMDNYCSSVLVNAICAMACHLHSATEGDEVDFEHLGAVFGEAVRADIADEDNKKVTTIQAFAIMFLVDCARSNAPRAGAYLKIATSSLSSIAPVDSDGFNEVLKNTVRGIRYLNVFVCSPASRLLSLMHSVSGRKQPLRSLQSSLKTLKITKPTTIDLTENHGTATDTSMIHLLLGQVSWPPQTEKSRNLSTLSMMPLR